MSAAGERPPEADAACIDGRKATVDVQEGPAASDLPGTGPGAAATRSDDPCACLDVCYGAWTMVRADAGGTRGTDNPFDWNTLRHDPALVEELRRSNRELMMSYAVALHAGRRGSFGAAALAIARCARQLHDVQRIEALRLYPAIARRMAADPEGAATVTSLRREANALARHFLRLTEGLFVRARPGMPPDSIVDEARAVLKRYLDEKETRLYRFYALTAPAGNDVA